jgi:hypothetical protein
MLIVMENHGAGSIIGNSAAPFENFLARRYVTLTNWTGVDHPSAPNYVALTTGQDNHQAGASDCTPSFPGVTGCDYVGDNLGVQLAAAGIPASWFAEGLSHDGCSIAGVRLLCRRGEWAVGGRLSRLRRSRRCVRGGS